MGRNRRLVQLLFVILLISFLPGATLLGVQASTEESHDQEPDQEGTDDDLAGGFGEGVEQNETSLEASLFLKQTPEHGSMVTTVSGIDCPQDSCHETAKNASSWSSADDPTNVFDKDLEQHEPESRPSSLGDEVHEGSRMNTTVSGPDCPQNSCPETTTNASTWPSADDPAGTLTHVSDEMKKGQNDASEVRAATVGKKVYEQCESISTISLTLIQDATPTCIQQPSCPTDESGSCIYNASQTMHPVLAALGVTYNPDLPNGNPFGIKPYNEDPVGSPSSGAFRGEAAPVHLTSLDAPLAESAIPNGSIGPQELSNPPPQPVQPGDRDSEPMRPTQTDIGLVDSSKDRNFLFKIGAAVLVPALLAAIWMYFSPWAGWFLSLFSRVSRAEALKHPTRKKIHEAVTRQPGICVADLCRLIGSSRGAVDYHVSILVRNELLSVRQEGLLFHLFANDQPIGRVQRRSFAALRNPNCRSIAAYVSDNPGATQSEISKAVDVSRRRLYAFLNSLRDAGLVESQKNGRTMRYYPMDDLIPCIRILEQPGPV